MAMGTPPLVDVLSPLDPEEFAVESRAAVDFIARYYRDIEKYPVRSEAEPGSLRRLLSDEPPENGEPMDGILADVQQYIVPGLTHFQSPNFFAYYPFNASTAGFVGEVLCAGLNVAPFTWVASPLATELEGVMMDWIGKLMGLPDSFLFSGGGGGVLHGSTCEAVICTLVAARDRALNRLTHEGILKMVVYASDQSHSTFQKGAKLVGIPPSNFRVIQTSAASSYGLTLDGVRNAVEADIARGLVPLYLCATVGTTGVGAVDPVGELGELAQHYGMWLHVDAAYAGSALICPEFQDCIQGVGLADSVSMNPHKWFLTNMDCCCLWVTSPAVLTSALSITPEYLNDISHGSVAKTDMIDYKDWQIALTRRFRAIKLWVVLRRYGAVGLRANIRRHVEMAKWFELALKADDRFEVIVPRRFSLVCFRFRPRYEGDHTVDALNRKFLNAVNASGKAFMIHTIVDNKCVIRLAIGATMTEMRHIRDTFELVQEKATEIGQDRD
ncbi:Tyrosine/DOPA decarboxylase 3 [Triticum urartu]|uniref:Tyrosine/DOPA decarboxylase 3 n=1 Tax=Triticum urartu TaxID=4572 RepID=M8A3M4_TRIUA|nr:tyrosine decarboxylase 1-like [Triticum urartu]EMS66556.1 Tyrosine/DOPA decarboxylase 3 [Triticum urartu]